MDTEFLTTFLSWEMYHNPVQTWLSALAVMLGVLLALMLVRRLTAGRLAEIAVRTETDLDDLLVDLINATRSFFFAAIALFIGAQWLDLPKALKFINLIPILALLGQFGLWGDRFIVFMLNRYTNSRATAQEQLATRTIMTPVHFVAAFILWALLLLVALDNLGMDVTALITGLGIGGVAVALAVQNILGDLLATLSIIIDKPFVLGDFIIVDTLMGTVEHIGLKTTRVRSLHGEQLIFSNGDLLKSRVRNMKRMEERRILFTLKVPYQTAQAQLESIPGLVREIVESQESVRFDRAHFARYGDSALEFEVVYFVLTPDYNQYMGIQERINLAVFRRFAEAGITFAYPAPPVLVAPQNVSTDQQAER